ncbi:hypothetical protein [Burkholderia lata]|uniref:Uncharacterized protein n=1 Tax=Burkholderia lata (strain ATCC 17760 / DSM 23089 / LMG 22485 / NCIMB 9086 / R18194 / 383) TaxID=482957 RepID=A0A6P2GUT1_BURL3|nr:hypothetical protein [Burkholderia lata]VWB08280.1 hypothetical protein BLA6863_00209 [Burkholderia lata]
MRFRDNAPVGYTCPDIDAIISILEGVADRLDEVASQIDSTALSVQTEDLGTQAANLRQAFEGRSSALEKLRAANDALRDWGNKECERADDAEKEMNRLRDEIRDLEST